LFQPPASPCQPIYANQRRSDLQLPRHLPRGANNPARAGNLLSRLRFLKVTVQVGSKLGTPEGEVGPEAAISGLFGSASRPTGLQPITDPNPISKTRSGSGQFAGGTMRASAGECASWAHAGQSPIAYIER
jgi:hypothetical protein